ncbi:hypothetical protein HUT16_08170 [Kitasatospora sp. NA04385]|uniref:hypothetical protein n=1 Tax=Kitasatospora sp. NA04385 TaxID=2742135 RepID=UPI0015911E17|nr:hypothetical protein [Kitasatospora sp. NA04385]QKW19046.1 hypothetical protein HUT16_08170 [Kitasatospora sp. NA04385]
MRISRVRAFARRQLDGRLDRDRFDWQGRPSAWVPEPAPAQAEELAARVAAHTGPPSGSTCGCWTPVTPRRGTSAGSAPSRPGPPSGPR